SMNWHNLQINSFHISVFAAGAILLTLYWFFFTFSSRGLSIRAYAENPLTARAMGVSAKRLFALSWAIAALLCTLCGVLLSTVNGLNSDSLSAAGLKVFPVIILGGLNSIKGAILGGIIIGLLETFSGGYIEPSLKDIAPYFALVLFLILKPSNFFQRTELEKR
ncbi:MAG TPA: branched-chain amino acid ABC transporter permease, partial [Desulfobacteria bacterium]|nr:branched-chain amino acid ABC transporter permease [Desulfobacteria bacterium]